VIHTKQAPYTTYVVGLAVPSGAITHALFWDTAETPGSDSYHYVRLHPAGDHDVLIVGGADHKTGQTKDFERRFDELEAWARTRFPDAGPVEYRWSGQVMEPVDLMAFIGRNPADEENVYVSTGDSGNGITHGAIAGMLISDFVTGTDNAWAKLYDPSRKTAKAVPEFLHENLNVLAQMSDYVTRGDKDSPDNISSGHGAVIREGLAKVAVYRDEGGSVHRFSAVCPHLKCIVHWNSTERTWDCPCHGSRFDALGTVITGPANSNLAPA
jgi:Rieske Fe-S protein